MAGELLGYWQNAPDRDLVAHARDPSTPAERETVLGEIYNRYEKPVLRLCARYFGDDGATVQDLVATTFEVAMEELAEGPNPPSEPDKLLGWLCVIARGVPERGHGV